MQPTDFKRLRLESSPIERLGRGLYRPLFWITILGFLAASGGMLYGAGQRLEWAYGVLLVLAGFVAGLGLARQLPSQNVIGAVVVAALIASGAHSMGSATGVPFGPYVYSQDMGRPLLGVLPWTIPFVWVLFLVASRGAARLILRPWRRSRTYGFNLIGLTAVLVVMADVGLEVFATRVFHYWKWSKTKLHLELLGIPVTNFIAWALVAILVLVFITPLLINKKPVPASSPDLDPAILWLAANLFFLSAALSTRLHAAALVVGGQILFVAGLAALGRFLKIR